MKIEDIRNDIVKRNKKNIEIVDIKIKNNCGIVFIKHDRMKEDLSGFYKDFARILYKQALS